MIWQAIDSTTKTNLTIEIYYTSNETKHIVLISLWHYL